MTKKQKAAALAAGVAITAAVGTASLPDSAQELVDATQSLYAKSEDRGITLPEDPGIRDVRNGMYDMAPTQGRDMELTVSAEGPIETGDNLTLCHQFKKSGGSTMFLDNATLLAVDTAYYTDTETKEVTTYAAIVFTRVVDEGPYTYMGVMELGETPTLGGMIILAEGALPEADVTILPAYGLAVATYTNFGVSWAKCAQIGPGATLENAGRCEVATGDPVNLNVDSDEMVNLVFSCVRTVDGKSVISVVHGVPQTKENLTTLVLSEPIDLTADRFPALKNLTFDPAQAPEQWDLAITADFSAISEEPETITEATAFLYDGTAYLSCPKADGKGQNVIILRTGEELLHPVSLTERTFDGEVSGVTAVTAYPGNTGVVATINHDPRDGSSWATLQSYNLADTYDYPHGRHEASTGSVIAQSITDVGFAIGTSPWPSMMVADGTLYLTAHEMFRHDRGPTQAVAENVARGTVMITGDDTVWCVTQSTDGALWLTPYKAEKVVRKAYEGSTVDGTAIQGGEPGETCKASIWRDATDDYFAPIGGGEGTT